MKEYTISIYSKCSLSLLNRIIIIFTRHRLHIESINAYESEIKEIQRYIIVLKANREQVEKVVLQIEKVIEVQKAFIYNKEDCGYQKIAL